MPNVREIDLASMRHLWRAIPAEALARHHVVSRVCLDPGRRRDRTFADGGWVVLGAAAHGRRLFRTAGRRGAVRGGRVGRARGDPVMRLAWRVRAAVGAAEDAAHGES
jgi:hypothetical protein